MKFIFKAFSHKIRSFLITKQALVQSLTKISIERVDVFQPQNPLILKEKYFETILGPITLSPNISAVWRWNKCYLWVYRMKRKEQVLNGIYLHQNETADIF